MSSIYTKVKFVRNLKDHNFESNIYDDEQKQILDLSLNALNQIGVKGMPLTQASKDVIDSLVAQGLLEQEFASYTPNRGLASINNTIIQINNNNHIEIIAKDINIVNAYNSAKDIDKKLCNKLNFAYSDKYGFLAPNIKDIGSGLTIEFKVILPSLAQIGALNKIPKAIDKLMFNITCLDRQSGMCIITTQATLGYSEKQVCELAQNYLDKIIKLEIETAKGLFSENKDDVLDKTKRAISILKSCIKITPFEAQGLLGYILIGVNAGAENNIKIEQINNALNIINLYENDYKKLAQEIQKIIV